MFFDMGPLVAMLHPITKEVVACFSSKNEAAKSLGVNRKHLARACHSGMRRLCCGYLWDDETVSPHIKIHQALQATHIEQAKRYLQESKKGQTKT